MIIFLLTFKLTREQFLKKAINIHGNKYDYNKVKYVNKNLQVEIICLKHGSFFQTPATHFTGSGCPKCKISKGEDRIRRYLDINNIEHIQQYSFLNCKNLETNYILKFDFYLPAQNLCIEFDGLQHFEPSSFSSDKTNETKNKNLIKIKQRDNIKNQYCKDNNIKLLRIPYWKINNIEKILDTRIK